MEVRFPAYRRFEAARIAAHDAMWILLVGTRLAASHLSSVDSGDQNHHLPDLFPHIPDVRRMNRTVVDTIDLFEQSETHLSYMAIPYILSVYQTLTVDAIVLLRQAEIDTNSHDPASIPLDEIHRYLTERGSFSFADVDTALFDFIRQIRNRIIHFGGAPGSHLRPAYRGLPGRCRELWVKWTGREFRMDDTRSPMGLTPSDLIPALAVTKRLSRAINHELARKLPRSLWAHTVVDDYSQEQPDRFGERAQRLRRVTRYADHRYGMLNLTSEELKEALDRWDDERGSRRGGSSY
jgi:hypothetical protein